MTPTEGRKVSLRDHEPLSEDLRDYLDVDWCGMEVVNPKYQVN